MTPTAASTVATVMSTFPTGKKDSPGTNYSSSAWDVRSGGGLDRSNVVVGDGLNVYYNSYGRILRRALVMDIIDVMWHKAVGSTQEI